MGSRARNFIEVFLQTVHLGVGGWRFSLLACGLFESGVTLIWVWSPLSKLGKSVLSDKVDQSDYRRITVHSMKVDCRS